MTTKRQIVALLPAHPAIFPCFFPPPVRVRVGGSAAPLAGEDIMQDSCTARASFLHSWPTWEEWVYILILGGVFFIIPERRGIFIITAKLNSLLMKGERRIGRSCGIWMVNTAGSR